MTEDHRMKQLAADLAKVNRVTPAHALAAIESGCAGADKPMVPRRGPPLTPPKPKSPRVLQPRNPGGNGPGPYYQRDPLERVTVKK